MRCMHTTVESRDRRPNLEHPSIVFLSMHAILHLTARQFSRKIGKHRPSCVGSHTNCTQQAGDAVAWYRGHDSSVGSSLGRIVVWCQSSRNTRTSTLTFVPRGRVSVVYTKLDRGLLLLHSSMS
jgi:hypothetical protein